MIYLKVIKQVFSFLDRKEKIKSFYFILLSFIAIMLETIGIASFFPLTTMLLEGKGTSASAYSNIFKILNFENITLNIFFLFFFIFFIFKNFFLLFFTYWQSKYLNQVALRINDSALSNYLQQPFIFYTKNNSSLLIRNINETGSLDSILLRIVNLINDLFLIVGILVFLILLEPLITGAIVLIILIVLYTFNFYTKIKVTKWGKDRYELNGSLTRNLYESINSFREILLSGKKNYFTRINLRFRFKLLNLNLRYRIIEFLPRIIIELLIIAAVIFLILSLIKTNISVNSIIPILSVYAVATFKIMPAALKIFGSLQNFLYIEPILENIENITKLDPKKQKLKSYETIVERKKLFDKKIEIKNLSFLYEKNDTVIRNVNLQIKKGEIVALIGKSGTGKSTILNIISGLLNPLEGEVVVDDVNINLNFESWRQQIGYVSQSVYLLDKTIAENIAFGHEVEEIDINKVNECIKQSGLDEFISSNKEGINHCIGESGLRISGGQKQRIALARALYKNPKFLILDEATNSLDSDKENEIFSILKKLKLTILIISHSNNSLSIADSVYELKNRKISKIK